MKNKIGKFIKKIRKTHNYATEEFALKIMKISSRQLKKIEKGEFFPSYEVLLRIIIFLEIDAPVIQSIIEIFRKNSAEGLISDIYKLIEQPVLHIEYLEQKLEVLNRMIYSEEHAIDDVQMKKIEKLELFILSYMSENAAYTSNFVVLNKKFMLDNPHLVLLLFPKMSINEILAYLQSIQKDEIRDTSKYTQRNLISIYLNALGYLIQDNFKNKEYLDKLYEETYVLILLEHAHYLLPIIFRYKAIISYRCQEYATYKLYIEKSMILAKMYKKNKMLKHLQHEKNHFDKNIIASK